jgi:hypothetical protein
MMHDGCAKFDDVKNEGTRDEATSELSCRARDQEEGRQLQRS